MVKLNNKGFTLIELMVTVILLAVIVGIGTFSISSVMKKTKEEDYKLLVKEIKNALELSYQECKVADVDYSSNMCFMLGDANMDLKINSMDATLCLQYSDGMRNESELFKYCDVNADGVVTEADATLILQYSAQLINEFIDSKTVVKLGDLIKFGFIKGNGKDNSGNSILVNTKDSNKNSISDCKVKYIYKNGKINVEAAGQNASNTCPTTSDYSKY